MLSMPFMGCGDKFSVGGKTVLLCLKKLNFDNIGFAYRRRHIYFCIFFGVKVQALCTSTKRKIIRSFLTLRYLFSVCCC